MNNVLYLYLIIYGKSNICLNVYFDNIYKFQNNIHTGSRQTIIVLSGFFLSIIEQVASAGVIR